jgi:competence protein ComFC
LSKTPELKMGEIDAIVPVPLHKNRRRERGFNQVELLAEIVGKYLELPVTPALARVKNTAPQFGLHRDARLENIKGAFKVVDRKAVANRKLVLIDDIYTTGATVAECSRVLQNAGARRVEILTLSRAVENLA